MISTIFHLKDSNRARSGKETTLRIKHNKGKYKYAYDKCAQWKGEKGKTCWYGKRTRQKETDTLEELANRFKISNHIWQCSTEHRPSVLLYVPQPPASLCNPFGDPLVASRAKKFKFTPSSGSEGRSGQLTVALFSHFHAFSGSSKPAMWWRAKNWRRVCIVVLMPRVVKREHLHNQIIKICIILFFTIRMPHSFTAALPPFFHPTKWKKNTTFKFQFVFLSGERHYSHRYLANSTSVYRSCHSSSINTKWCQYLLANLFLIFDCDAIFKILQHLTINCGKFVYRMILKIVRLSHLEKSLFLNNISINLLTQKPCHIYILKFSKYPTKLKSYE